VKYYTNKARQAGMTLIELTVVLLVLVGLAGLLIPYVSGFVTKTHDSTGSSNIQALNNAMARYQVEHYDRFPDQMDSLLEADNSVYSKMMSSIMPMMGTGNYLAPLQIDAAKAKALKDVGIKTLMVMDDTTGDATFRNTSGAATVGAGSFVAEITSDAVLADLGTRMGTPTDPTIYHYVVFGIGDDSKIAGATIAQVPVHFAANGDMGANNAYNHFVGVFEILKQDACDASGWSSDYSPIIPGVTGDNTVDVDTNAAIVEQATTDQTIPDTATLSGITTMANCNALNSVTGGGIGWDGTALDGSTAVSGSGAFVTSGVVWKTAGSDKARFMGSAMAMGMNNIEGLGGAMTRYYNNQVTN